MNGGEKMKKLISLLLVLLLLPSVLAMRTEDKTEPINNFKVLKWISNLAPNSVVVVTINAGEKGYVVISATSQDKYAEGVELAKTLVNTAPTQVHGTKFALVRARI